MTKKIIYFLSFLSIINYAFFSIASDNHTPSSTDSSKDKDNKIQTKVESLEFINPWARPTMSPSNNSAAYLKIKNNSDKDYNLIGASAIDVANNVELHQTFVDEKGVSKMSLLNKIIVPAHSEIELKPGGMHIMLFDLKRSIISGDKFKLNLKFEDQIKTIDVEVKSYVD